MNTTWKAHQAPEPKDLSDKRVILRLDWNLPVSDGIITDTSRFDVTVPYLKELSFAGAKVIILTHFGEKGESLRLVAEHAKKELSFISFTESQDFTELEKLSREIPRGEMLLLDNVRLFKGETDNLPSLAKSFASLGDIFINNAFSVSHRSHASVEGVARLITSYFGPTFMREIENLTKALTPVKPAILIVGGAKISTKLELIKQYLDQGVQVFVGGAMVHNIWKERGLEIGASFYDPSYKLPESFVRHPMLLTPIDVILSDGTT
jgi:3-phosphoglycerate kinase